MATDDNDASWRFDKKIPLALIVAMVMQTLTFGWWAGATSQRVTDLERKAEVALPLVSLQSERLVRVETKMDGIVESLKELKTTLQRMPPIQRN